MFLLQMLSVTLLVCISLAVYLHVWTTYIQVTVLAFSFSYLLWKYTNCVQHFFYTFLIMQYT
jgi:hypothetical protein